MIYQKQGEQDIQTHADHKMGIIPQVSVMQLFVFRVETSRSYFSSASSTKLLSSVADMLMSDLISLLFFCCVSLEQMLNYHKKKSDALCYYVLYPFRIPTVLLHFLQPIVYWIKTSQHHQDFSLYI